MPSPFPGMDPWLESPRYFGDLHDSLIYNLQASLQPLLPRRYFASKGVRVWLETVAEVTERYLDIWTTEEGHSRLVTSIEILSPSNKAPSGEGRTLYLKKQREIMVSNAHLIEIDLLRRGVHTTAVPRAKLLERAEPFDYHVCLHCFDQPSNYYLYPFRLPEPLPEVAVPLLPGDPVLTVALQPILDRSYDAGAFDRRVRYFDESPEPPLPAEQREWARSVLASTRGGA